MLVLSFLLPSPCTYLHFPLSSHISCHLSLSVSLCLCVAILLSRSLSLSLSMFMSLHHSPCAVSHISLYLCLSSLSLPPKDIVPSITDGSHTQTQSPTSQTVHRHRHSPLHHRRVTHTDTPISPLHHRRVATHTHTDTPISPCPSWF